MGADTKIQWAHHTFNPWEGCAKVSPGCKHCYAEERNARFHPRPAEKRLLQALDMTKDVERGEHWGVKAPRLMRVESYWNQPLRWQREAEGYGPKGRRRRVFCASLADVFEDRPDLVAPRARLFDLIAKTPSLDWLLLTKRPQNMVRLAPASWADRWPGNAWAGTTIEDEERLAERAPHLFKVPAPVKFYSMEPLLESVDISDYLVVGGPDWVIVGGESGPGARPMHLSWVRNIVHDCLENGVAPFVKQYGEQPYDWTPDGLREDVNPRLVFEPQWSRPVKLKEKKGGDIDEFEPMLRVRQVPGYADVDGIEVRS